MDSAGSSSPRDQRVLLTLSTSLGVEGGIKDETYGAEAAHRISIRVRFVSGTMMATAAGHKGVAVNLPLRSWWAWREGSQAG